MTCGYMDFHSQVLNGVPHKARKFLYIYCLVIVYAK